MENISLKPHRKDRMQQGHTADAAQLTGALCSCHLPALALCKSAAHFVTGEGEKNTKIKLNKYTNATILLPQAADKAGCRMLIPPKVAGRLPLLCRIPCHHGNGAAAPQWAVPAPGSAGPVPP